jgi:hypothetical protein
VAQLGIVKQIMQIADRYFNADETERSFEPLYPAESAAMPSKAVAASFLFLTSLNSIAAPTLLDSAESWRGRRL